MPANTALTDTLSEEKRCSSSVMIPDLFCSLMSPAARVSPYYEKVNAESNAWVGDIFGYNAAQVRKVAAIECAYLAALWAPDADEYMVRLVSDWLQWVFFFDDLFDDGPLREDQEGAKQELEETYALMTDTPQVVSKKEHPIRYMYYDIWRRFSAKASEPIKARFKTRLRTYFAGVLGQISAVENVQQLDMAQYMDFRARSIGTGQVFVLLELAYGIDIPGYVLQHPSLRICERIASELVFLVNDITSYRKEMDLDDDYSHSILTLLRRDGLSLQGAMDRVSEIYRGCFKRWHCALADMDIYGQDIDAQVQGYVEACRMVALGNLHWSFACPRYLGTDGEEVRRTRVLSLDRELNGQAGNGTTSVI